MKKTTIEIKGMHCKSCEMLIEEALSGLGVAKCTVDSSEGVAVLEFDEKKVDLAKIKKAIEAEGYKVK